jgi:hypothetical protein
VTPPITAPLPPQPLFTLAFEAGYCRFTLRFNDLPVVSLDASTSIIDTEVPLNLSLLTGDNVLSVLLHAGERDDDARTPVLLSHPATRCVAEVTVRALGAPASERRRLGGIVYEGGRFSALTPDADAPVAAPSGPVATLLDTPTAALARQVLPMPNPFPAWLWSRAEVLQLDDATTADVVAQYRRFWAALQQRDTGTLRALMVENAREAQTAFGLPSLDDAYGMLTLEDLVRRPSVTVLPMATDDLHLELLADGRVARLTAPDGRSAIRLHDSDLGVEGAVGALYCRLTGRGWVQIR